MTDEKTTTSPWDRENPVEVEDIKEPEKPKAETWDCGATKDEHMMARRLDKICTALCRNDQDVLDLKAGICILAGGLIGDASDEDEVRYRNIFDKHFQEHREERGKEDTDAIADLMARIFSGKKG